MRIAPLAPVALLVLLAACERPAQESAALPLETDEQKTLYAIGLALSRNLVQFELTPAELALVTRGLADGLSDKKPEVELAQWGAKIQELSQARSRAAAEREKAASADFLARAAAEPGAQRTPSGLVYVELTPGSGDRPGATDRVQVHYHGTLIDGTVFDSSRERGQPATFPLNGVIKCWTEGVGMMKVGGKAKLVCPADIAYGDRGMPPRIKPGATLVFEVELLGIEKPGAAPAG